MIPGGLSTDMLGGAFVQETCSFSDRPFPQIVCPTVRGRDRRSTGSLAAFSASGAGDGKAGHAHLSGSVRVPCFLPQVTSGARASPSETPGSVTQYSTSGGALRKTVRSTSPLASISRSCWVSIFSRMPGIERFNALNRCGSVRIDHRGSLPFICCRQPEKLDPATIFQLCPCHRIPPSS